MSDRLKGLFKLNGGPIPMIIAVGGMAAGTLYLFKKNELAKNKPPAPSKTNDPTDLPGCLFDHREGQDTKPDPGQDQTDKK
jgi:hypothetical protein